MNTDNPNSMREMIYSNLQLKDTEELIEIWTQNDHEVWTDEAFDIIRELLLKRIGHLPEQNRPEQSEEQVDLYHNPETLLKIASGAKEFSWIIVIVSSLFLCGNLYQFVNPNIAYFSQSALPYLPYLTIAILMPLGGIFCFIVLQAIAELIYLFMDIEDNTRGE